MTMLNRPKKLLQMLIPAVSILLLVQNETVFSSKAPASQNPDSAAVASKDTFDVIEAQMLIIYPKGKLLYKKPHRPNEIKRGGSFVSVDFLIQYENVTLQEILFQTFESCSIFAIQWEKHLGGPYDDGEGFPKRWYSPDEFKKQKEAMQRNEPVQDFVPTLIENTKFLNYCYHSEPCGCYVNENFTFIDGVRIIVHMNSDKNCDKMSEKYKSLLSKIEFKPYQQKKNDKR